MGLGMWTACGSFHNYGYPDTGDTSVTNDSGEVDTADTSDTEDTSGIVDTSDTEDTSDTQDTNWPSGCHAADPLQQAGWTRTYAVLYKGKNGTETQTGLGNGDVKSVLQAGDDGWDIITHHQCTAGRAEVTGWEGDVVQTVELFPGFAMPTTYVVTATLSAPRPYLPDTSTLGSGGAWNYSYNLNVVAEQGTDSPYTGSVPTTGQFAAWGAQSNPNSFTSAYSAYMVTHEYNQDWSTFSLMGLNGMGAVSGFGEAYYVKGVGLVHETITDINDTNVLLQKNLTSFTGLTPQ